MQIFPIDKGIKGVRQIAAARAEIELRKLGLAPKIEYKNNGSNRAWTDGEYDEAIVMRLRGWTHKQIAEAIGRTKIAVDSQLGKEAHPQRCMVAA